MEKQEEDISSPKPTTQGPLNPTPNTNPYPTTVLAQKGKTTRKPTAVVHADTSSFREMVQKLTGSAAVPSYPIHREKRKIRRSPVSSEDEEKDETSCAEVLNLMEPTSECKAGSSTTPIDSLFSDSRLSLRREAPIYGRDDVKKKVIEFLSADGCMDRNVSVIRIVGIGGVGKTTLVKRVYDELIPYAIFEARAWVSVNERLDIKGITKAVIESLAGTSCGLTELREVQEAVKEELMGKRFLLVLDNVCDDAPSFWSSLLVPLSVGASGSIIIATARSEKECIMDTLSHYKLDRLSENECWLVFQQQVFDRWGQKVCSNLMEIGKQIIRRCEGLPLAVRAFGGLLQSDLNERSWNAILESNLWDEDGNLPALGVCCDHLTVHLQQCFQYCSLFPKGYMFDKDHLIRLWMSHGFIENEDGKHVHDLGCKYFNEMLEMSFFQLSPISDPTEKKYMMHDLFHDLAQFLSVNKCLRIETCKLSSIPDAVRHVSLASSGFDTTLQFASLRELGDIHTLLLINSSIMKWEASAFHVEDPKILNDLFSRLGCLRTLDLSFTDIEEVPESIDNLQHLCYLALNRTNIRKLPESICSLYNLQTLELQGCNYLSQLPTQLKNLTNLQHLDASKESGFISMPPGIGQLTGLRTLSTFTVGRGERWCGIRELEDLMNLSGAFCIGGLCNVVNGEEAEEAQLKMKKNLRTLTLQWFNCGEDLEDDQSAETASEVLQNLQPHNNLEELTIRDYSGDQFPSWITDPSFLKLMSITLDNCYECDDLPLLGQLPSLKHLSIRMMDGIQRLGNEFCGSGPSRGFQSLETLKLWDMPELIEWSGVEEEYFPRLRNLSISRCNKLRGFPCFPSLLELSIHCCTQLSDLPTFQCLKSLKIDGLQILPLPQLNLPALETLEISNCNQLLLEDSLSHLPSLKQLKVNRCPELNFSPSDKLPSTLQVVEICGSWALHSSWFPDGFQEITDAHQTRRKLVRCKTTTNQRNSVDDFSTCQVVDPEMLSFGATGGELPATTAMEESLSGLTSVGSTGQRQSKKRSRQVQIEEVESINLQLAFRKPPALPIFTGSNIEDSDNNPLQILLIDTQNGSNSLASLPMPLKLEVVVLDGDFPAEGPWTSADFNNAIVKERTGRRPLLTGEFPVILRDGIASIGALNFTDNSSWIRSKLFRIGVRVVQEGYKRSRVREAVTEAFSVKDHRGDVYKKHYPPSLTDEVWRLEWIGKDGAFHNRLSDKNINTVHDFLKLWAVNPILLRKILGVGMSDRMWEGTIGHAKTCPTGDTL